MLAMPVAAVATAGNGRENPSDHFIPKANPISSRPATARYIHDMGCPLVRSRPPFCTRRDAIAAREQAFPAIATAVQNCCKSG
jgi:hypothetical protein